MDSEEVRLATPAWLSRRDPPPPYELERRVRRAVERMPAAGATIPETLAAAAFHCLEDSALVAELRERQIPLEVCPTSNVCLGEFPTMQEHPLPRLADEGLYVTINSDDPPMFNTTLTDEYLSIAHTFGYDADDLEWFVMNAVPLRDRINGYHYQYDYR